tara:strand:+ start:11119 stop:11721 length:603 start_codon:yes stop_codon:yes gene_type:complete
MQELHWLNIRDLDFPDPERALTVPNGLLAAGGDLNPERLLRAYKHGIFPWYEAGQPILWWSPDPRMVLYPDELHISKSLQKTLNKAYFSITWNHDFRAVINSCAGIGIKNREDTWISSAMKQAYTELHEQGWAHSLEVWQDEKLVGGLYGIAMGRVFLANPCSASKTMHRNLHLYTWSRPCKDLDSVLSTARLLIRTWQV